MPTTSSKVFSLMMVSLYLNLIFRQNYALFLFSCHKLFSPINRRECLPSKVSVLPVNVEYKLFMSRQKQFFPLLLYDKQDIHRSIIHIHYFTQITMMHIVYLKSDEEIPRRDFILLIHVLHREIHFHVGKTTCLFPLYPLPRISPEPRYRSGNNTPR